jgi:hypothetical protein
MKNILITLILGTASLANAQTREIYAGASLSNMYWLEENSLNSSIYSPGVHIGFLKGPKEKTGVFKKKNRAFFPFFGVEYNYFQHETDNKQLSDYHSLKTFVSLRYNFLRSQKSFNSLFIVAEPGAALLFHQKNQFTLERSIVRADPFDLFMQAGIGAQISFNKEAPKKDKFQCTGMTISATKYFSVTPFSIQTLPANKLDQLRLNIGLHFAFVKAKKEKKLFRFFR